MSDYSIVDIPSLLRRVVRSYDSDMKEIPYDGAWHREVTETYYVLAELLVSKGLVIGKIRVSRTPDLVIKWSQLTDLGQAFLNEVLEKWLRSIDRAGMPETTKAEKLERRWRKFTSAQA